MQEQTDSIASVLTGAEQAHGAVFHYVGGDDADWASFYADFLVNHSPLPAMLATPPTRGHLTAALIEMGQRYETEKPDMTWEAFSAPGIVARFGPLV